MNKVYAVGTLKCNTNPTATRFVEESRLWYLMSSLQNAEQTILHNDGDLFEDYFNFGLIEEVILADTQRNAGYIVPNQYWFYRDPTTEIITAVEKPKVIENIVCFWVG